MVGMRLKAALHDFIQWSANLDAFNQLLELAADRLGRFARDNVQTFVDRKTRPDTAHDHVDSIGEVFGEQFLTFLGFAVSCKSAAGREKRIAPPGLRPKGV